MTLPRLPEPNMALIGGMTDVERAERHDQWHLDNPNYGPCTAPERPRSSHRPGQVERWRRDPGTFLFSAICLFLVIEVAALGLLTALDLP